MKTFKLYSIYLLKGKSGKLTHYPLKLERGLIINMENSKQTWLIEAVVEKEQFAFFNEVQQEDKDLLIDVVISRKDNYPATLITKVSEITQLSSGISILMKGNLILGKDEVLEDVVEDLVDENYKGPEFIDEFKRRKANLTAHSQRTLDEVYEDLLKKDDYRLV
ncbi:hypothetical protein AJ85_01875 [Alkalihalobacillus alcalophilus ATCC 27647 = CGMCC 1.3604]|uniref:YwpF-like protein n=1 Tax=Alkalihalobacillus alcalophilus ATCC 27647 = CGMCC 1.3604 TaxID=1218173 RepID=A0A094YZ30_ALKAL|nr:YwpF family protein [Alkalihalobacillus alcalophilus]KGA98787.1 hypothetical protein BALCAV_0202460 [Alkalihalobacillus alcalophilus ATCC 27647 = CGMCC 1.3604]MED1560969.1 YwpF family protein [Alkalihalobacillus alcalophilus]THG91773.1 hypothetical protein AJ85_01875 [Alkalihalobacillus alcalophilus ATCC 27647 = CGMCC 1.3604]